MAGQLKVPSRDGMVSSAHPLASEAGAEMLRQGGNAVDAAVAAAFAIGVAEPFTSGIGGGGFMLVRMAGSGREDQSAFIDYREVAPKGATPGMYEVVEGQVAGRANETGHRAVAVPGSVAGMAMALEMYGTMTLREVVEPAARLAEGGITVGPFLKEAMRRNLDRLRLYPRTARIYLKDGHPYEPGDILVNPDYARTLRLIGREGPRVFYEGEVARALVRDMQVHGGLIGFDDLAGYRPTVRQPVTGTYRGYEILSSPPPSSGGTHVLEILNMLEGYDVRGLGSGSTQLLHLLAEAFKMAFADREAFMGDPAFVDIPLKGLLSKEYALRRISTVDPKKASHPAPGHPQAHEGHSTTHLSTMDKWGNAVSLTQTVEGFFGSAVVLAGYGFILNNEMHDLDPVPGRPNSIAPGKKPLSSMSPTIVLKGGEPFLAVGSPGSKRIITAVTQVLVNVLDHGMGIQEAIDAPRIHAEDEVLHLEGGFDPVVRDELRSMGHLLDVRAPRDFFFGGAHGVMRDAATKEFLGGADPRREGRAIGI